MMLEDFMDKNKIRADDYITILFLINYLIFALFFRMEAFLSIIIYPFAALTITGVLKIISAFNKRNTEGSNINKVLFGVIAIIFSVLFLFLILVQPNITPNIIISLISFPLMIVGYAGIIKGILVDIYSVKHRIISIIVGTSTIIVCLLGFFSVINNFLLNIAALSLVFLFTILSRAALYLSEYGLSLINFKNFKLFLYIISDYLIYIDRNGNIVLSKIE